VNSLKETVGAPYTNVATEMLDFGGGGALGWGTLCGTLTGTLAAITLVTKDYGKVGNELIGWYTTTSFPTWVPAKPAKSSLSPFPTSVANSPLCHASISQWFTKSGFNTSSPEFGERCARLTAEVTKKAVLLLNANYASQFEAKFVPAASIQICSSCHATNQLGKQECVVCHKPLGHHGVEAFSMFGNPITNTVPITK
jgi:hypothetical protein